jgi:hypothetical protein
MGLAASFGFLREITKIVMVIAIGKKSPGHIDQPQWPRPLESTVTTL